MATKANAAKDAYVEPRVNIYIPKSEFQDIGVTTDQTEHVTVNGKTTIIQRGVRVDVPVDVYLALRAKYPDI